MRSLRSFGEIALLGLGVLLVGFGTIGLLLLVATRYGFSLLASRALWTLIALGVLALGVILLVLYGRLRRTASWEKSVAPLPEVRGGYRARLQSLLRRLAGGVCAVASAVCLFYGLIGGSVWLLSSLPGGAGLLPQDAWLTENIWWGLPSGFVFAWATYLCWMDRQDLQRLLAWQRRTTLLATINGLVATTNGTVAPPARQFGWDGTLSRFAGLWLTVGVVGDRLSAWSPGGRFILQSAAVCGLIWVGMGVIILIHELGHVLGARLAGVAVTGLRVGRGPVLWNWRWLGLNLSFHACPAYGCAYVGYQTEEHFRLRWSVVYAGAPLAHGLALAAIFSSARWLAPAEAQAVAALGLVGGYSLAFGSLLPFRIEQRKRGQTEYLFLDAAALLNGVRLPDSYVRWRVCLDLTRAASRQAFSTDLAESQTGSADLAALLKRYPENELPLLIAAVVASRQQDWALEAARLAELLTSQTFIEPLPFELRSWARGERAIALAMAGDFPVARLEIEANLESEAPVATKVAQLDRLACLPLMHGLAGYKAEAIHWAERALALSPDSLTLQGTRGALLVELGRSEEAGAILAAVRTSSASPTDRGISALYLALIARQGGRSSEAATLASEALELCPGQAWMTARWECPSTGTPI